MKATDVSWQGWAERRVRAVPRQAACELAGETVILHLDTGQYYGLDEVAAQVWKWISGEGPGPTVSEISAKLLAIYEVDAATCRQDLLELLASLREAGLIEVQLAGAA